MNSIKKPKFFNQRDIFEGNIYIINNLLYKYRFKKIINSIKFSCFFFNDRKSVSPWYHIKQVKRIAKLLISLKINNDYKFISSNGNRVDSNIFISFISINTTDAIHYNKLESKLIELIKKELLSRGINVKHSSLVISNQAHSFGWATQLYNKVKALYILFTFTKRTLFIGEKDAYNLVFNDLDKLYIQIVKYLLDYKYFTKMLQCTPTNFVITVNENWMPQSVFIDCCKELKILTAIYPHGIIGSTITLPSECDIFLFWNEQMKKNFENLTFDKERNIVIGALEPLVEDNYSLPTIVEYDVLIISQLSVANEGNNIIYKDIFFVWESFIEAHPDFKVCIKLHPFEGEKEYKFLNEIFIRFGSQVTIVQDRKIPIVFLIQKSKYISTVSSSAITYGFYFKKPILLYNPPASLFDNFPISEQCIFKSLNELEEIINKEQTMFSNMNRDTYSWVEEIQIKNNVRLLVDKLISSI